MHETLSLTPNHIHTTMLSVKHEHLMARDLRWIDVCVCVCVSGVPVHFAFFFNRKVADDKQANWISCPCACVHRL